MSYLVVLITACSVEEKNTEDTTTERPVAGKKWGDKDKPSLLGDDFEYSLSALPMTGEAKKIPWAGTYWPTYKDSINDRWNGIHLKSPTEKYAEAFGREGLEDRISENYGIESTNGKSCTQTSECDSDQGEVCAKRAGEEQGQCTETWFGLCHAWAPTAILEEEPVNPVEHNGVTFKVNDIKALVTLEYTQNLEVKFMSLRCNEVALDLEK
jgi:hypothetical protein